MKMGRSVENQEKRDRRSWRKAQQSVADKIKPTGPAKQNAAKRTSWNIRNDNWKSELKVCGCARWCRVMGGRVVCGLVVVRHRVVAVHWPNTQSINYAATKYTNQRTGKCHGCHKVRGVWRSSGWCWDGSGVVLLVWLVTRQLQNKRPCHDPGAEQRVTQTAHRRMWLCGFCAVAAAASASVSASVDVRHRSCC